MNDADHYDVILMKSDTLGNLIWIKNYGSISMDMGWKITKTYDNNIIMATMRCGYYTPNNFYYNNDLISDTHFDLVLIELFLCGTDGFALIKMIRTIRKDIPIVALTVCATKEEREKCFKVGCDAFISKPFMVKIFIKVIEKTLRKKNLKNQKQINTNYV